MITNLQMEYGNQKVLPNAIPSLGVLSPGQNFLFDLFALGSHLHIEVSWYFKY